MKLVVLILNKVELLDDLLEDFAESGIKGATIFASKGMARELYSGGDFEDDSFLGSLASIINPDREESKTVFTVVKDDMVSVVCEIIEKVVGDLSKPDTGILFTLPVDYIKGCNIE